MIYLLEPVIIVVTAISMGFNFAMITGLSPKKDKWLFIFTAITILSNIGCLYFAKQIIA